MDLKRELESALRDIVAAKVAVGNELDKGGNVPFAYARITDAERKLKAAIRKCN